MTTRRGATDLRAGPNDFAQRLFAPLPARYDTLAKWLSFGQDPRWRAAAVAHVAASHPLLVLDVACGPGAVIRELATTTAANLIGVDLSLEMLVQGQRNIRSAGLTRRVSLVQARGEQLPFADATFDAVTFTYLLRYVEDPAATLAELARVLKPGGPIASVDFAVPHRMGWRFSWLLYTRALLPLAGLLGGGTPWWDVGRFLGPNISQHYARYSLEWIHDAWRRSGLERVSIQLMSLGGGVVMSGFRRGPE